MLLKTVIVLFFVTATSLVKGSVTPLVTKNDPQCAKGWSRFGDNCYKILRGVTTLSSDLASMECWKRGAQLANPQDKPTVEFLFSRLSVQNAPIIMNIYELKKPKIDDDCPKRMKYVRHLQDKTSYFYINLTGVPMEVTSMLPLKYFIRPSSLPDKNETRTQDGNHYCTVIQQVQNPNRNMNWRQTVSCSNFRGTRKRHVVPICQQKPQLKPILDKATSQGSGADPTDDPCPAENQFEGHCYTFIQEAFPVSWPEAEANCSLIMGGHLTSVHSSPEDAFIQSRILDDCGGRKLIEDDKYNNENSVKSGCPTKWWLGGGFFRIQKKKQETGTIKYGDISKTETKLIWTDGTETSPDDRYANHYFTSTITPSKGVHPEECRFQTTLGQTDLASDGFLPSTRIFMDNSKHSGGGIWWDGAPNEPDIDAYICKTALVSGSGTPFAPPSL